MAVVSAPTSLPLEDGCAGSCNLTMRLAAPASECVCELPVIGPLSSFAWLDKFSGAACMGMPSRPAGATDAGVEEGAVAGVDAIRTPVMVRAVCQVFPFATTTVVGRTVADVRTPVSLLMGRLLFVCPFDFPTTQAVVGSARGGVAVVRSPALQPMEDGCSFSCLIKLRLAAPDSEFVCEPSPRMSLSAFAFSDRFASAARKVMPVGLTGSRAAGMEEDVVVDKGAIRTPLLLHVACQHLPFATFSSPGGTY